MSEIRSIYRIGSDQRSILAPFFAGWEETLLWSYLDGSMGSAWADDPIEPKSAKIMVADFSFFAGKPSAALVGHKPEKMKNNFIIMVPREDGWDELIESIYPNQHRRVDRYAIKKEGNLFDRERLNKMVGQLSSEYELKMIDESIFYQILREEWSKDLCSHYKTYDDYQRNGLGIVVLYKGSIVSGASSYTYYKGGIEIEIDTRQDFRRRGLALACGAKLILECLQHGIYPSWDAQNKGSVALAEKLGYHYSHTYPAYEIYPYEGSDKETIEFQYTNGTDERFAALCYKLDLLLNQAIGTAKQREEYNKYNSLEEIQDVLIAYKNDEPVGCGSFKRYDETTAEIKRVFVEQACRQKGIATLLIKELENQAKKKGYKKLVVETGKPLIYAQKLYHNLGFERRENYGPYAKLPDSICMEKSICEQFIK